MRLFAHKRNRRHGFTLIEVMLAMAVFLIGFTAVMAIFPVAALLQKQTMDDLTSQVVSKNAQALMGAKGLVHAELEGEIPQDYAVHPLPGPAAAVDVFAKWTLDDRSYPSSEPDPEARRFYWVPMVKRTELGTNNPNDWLVYVFIMRRQDSSDYTKTAPATGWANFPDPATVPGVKKIILTGLKIDATRKRFLFTNDVIVPTDGAADLVLAGDMIVDEYGIIHTIISAEADGVTVAGYIFAEPNTGLDPSLFWYAAPPEDGRGSSGKRVEIISDAVK